MGAVHHPPMPEVRRAVAVALAEDLTPLGDLTAALLDPGIAATADFVPRAAGVLAGTRCASEAFVQLDPEVIVEWAADDGDDAVAGTPVGRVTGPLASMA